MNPSKPDIITGSLAEVFYKDEIVWAQQDPFPWWPAKVARCDWTLCEYKWYGYEQDGKQFVFKPATETLLKTQVIHFDPDLTKHFLDEVDSADTQNWLCSVNKATTDFNKLMHH